MKILRPVPVSKRLPVIPEGCLSGEVVLVRYSDDEKVFSFIDHESKWLNKEKTVVEWYEEIEIESLFPDDETSYRVANAFSNGKAYKTMWHSEGQDFVKNHILRQLKK